MSRLRPRVIFASRTDPRKAMGAAPQSAPDDYVKQLIKYIPAETITAYQGVAGLFQTQGNAVGSTTDPAVLWTAIICLVVTPIWTWFATRSPGDPPAWAQSIVSFLAFAVWLLAVNGTIGTWAFGSNWPRMGSIILILSTALIFPLLGRVLARFFGS